MSIKRHFISMFFLPMKKIFFWDERRRNILMICLLTRSSKILAKRKKKKIFHLIWFPFHLIERHSDSTTFPMEKTCFSPLSVEQDSAISSSFLLLHTSNRINAKRWWSNRSSLLPSWSNNWLSSLPFPSRGFASQSLSVTLTELKSPVYLCEKIIPSRLNTFPSSFPSIVSLSSLLPFPFPTSLLEQGVKSIQMDPIDFPT